MLGGARTRVLSAACVGGMVSIAVLLGGGLLCRTFLGEWYLENALTPSETTLISLSRLASTPRLVTHAVPNTKSHLIVTAAQAKCIQGAPQSLEIGLRLLEYLPIPCQGALGECLIIVGSDDQLTSYAEILSQRSIGRDEVLRLLKLLPLLIERNAAINPKWVQMAVAEKWGRSEVPAVLQSLAKLVEYNWNVATSLPSNGNYEEEWLGFVAWWKDNKSNAYAPSGAKIRIK